MEPGSHDRGDVGGGRRSRCRSRRRNGAAVARPRRRSFSTSLTGAENCRNGAAVARPRRLADDPPLYRRLRGAAMEPRSHDRGDAGSLGAAPTSAGCRNGAAVARPRRRYEQAFLEGPWRKPQWSRGRTTAETSGAPRSVLGGRRRNGAAVARPRRHTDSHRQIPLRCSRNGAAVARPRRQASWCVISTGMRSTPQWSRGRTTAETSVRLHDCPVRDAPRRNGAAVARPRRLAGVVVRLDLTSEAAMEPRSHDRGDPIPSFPGTSSHRLPQWSRGRTTAETCGSGAGGDGRDAAMEPRSHDRGDLDRERTRVFWVS